MGNSNDFYYNVLNSDSSNIDIVDIINKVVSDFMIECGITYYMVESYKEIVTALSERFNDFGVENVVLNTKELYNCFEHEVILVRNKEKIQFNYYLVDLAFKQFLNNSAVVGNCFEKCPVDRMMSFGKNELLLSNDLLKYGYSEIKSDLLSSYFSCFIDSGDRIVVDDIDKFFMERKHSRL